MIEKDRHLGLIDFLDNLQIEYYEAEIRKKISPELRNKQYWKKVMEGKKQKILDISERNSLQNIFSNEEIKKQYIKKVYPEYGLPNFKKLTDEDIKNYYTPNTEIRVEIDKKTFVGKIIECELCKNIIVVKLKGEEKTRCISLSAVTRIL